MSESVQNGPVVVIGAGIVGAATARALQRNGHTVTLLDSAEPGNATSFGNAGFLSVDSLIPLARPATLKKVPQMLMDRNGPLTLHPPSLPWLLPWMARFALAAMSRTEVQKGKDMFRSLMLEADIAWKAEIQASGLGELFRTRGALYVYESEASFQGTDEMRGLQSGKGTEFEIVDGNRARELAPGLSPTIVRGIHYPNASHTINPHKVVTTLVERFTAEGGMVVRGRVRGFRRDGDRVTAVQLTDSELPASAVMISAGRASGELTRLLGFNAPLVAERGYHVMVAPDNVRFDLPVSPPDRGLFFTPMSEGLRIAGTVELAAPHQPPSWHRADLLKKHLKDIFPGVGGVEQSRWIGERPTLPDYRPAIGRAPRLANVYCGYGHQHLGLTLATATGRLIARLMEGEQLPSALQACDPGRFG
ncbi:FAD-binding oxidoreductase [Reyranella sp.]|jgi:D-amino-acid dehydrogenase|uniref:NAD(P)/FAD-dependent oxidoreductase n=1 Tax=Reyranella sp. TaxID=1929291 RepID=UPI00272924E3|nr:FAD-dependent oxidoreductase [Reyranella sp.]MDO8975166.1 FAD-dependent oxidoreductase [Reyranella sp.]